MEDAARARMGDVMARVSTRDRYNWRESCLDVVFQTTAKYGKPALSSSNGELWTQAGDTSSEICKGT